MGFGGLFSALIVTGLMACNEEVPGEGAEPGPDEGLRLTDAQLESAGIRVVVVEEEDLSASVHVPGVLQPPDTSLAHVGAIVEGRVERVVVIPGDRVSEGDPLAFIHADELLAELRDLAVAESRLEYSRLALERAERLLEAGAISRQDAQLRQVEFDAVQAEYERTVHHIELLSPTEHGEVTVRTPRAGIVLEAHIHPGEAVLKGADLFTVGAVDLLWATAYIPEEEAVGIHPGAQAVVRVNALDGPGIPARLIQVGSQVDPGRRSVEVRVELDDVPEGIRPGMFVTVELLSASQERGVVLPAEAVQNFDGHPTVFIQGDGGEFRSVAVHVEFTADGRAQVQGLEAGSRAVVEGAYFLRSALEQGGEGES